MTDLRELEAETCRRLGIEPSFPELVYRKYANPDEATTDGVHTDWTCSYRRGSEEEIEAAANPKLIVCDVKSAEYPCVATSTEAFELVVEALAMRSLGFWPTSSSQEGHPWSARVCRFELGGGWHDGLTWKEAVCRAVCAMPEESG